MSIEAAFTLDLDGFRLDAEFAVPERGITALFGRSGSGKTTILRCIAGLERSAQGRLKVNGETWQDEGLFLPAHERPVGYVFQEASLFEHLSVRRNLEYGWKRVPAGSRQVDFDQAVEWLGIATLLGRMPDRLSGGERQRVAIARALLTSPRLLLMDEPLAALDHDSKAEILPYLERLHGELAVPLLYVSHSPDEVARLADTLVLLEAGRVRAQGRLDELLPRLDLPLAHGDSAGVVVDCEVLDHDSDYLLTRLRFGGGHILVAHRDLPVGSKARLRVLARDVSLALEHHVDSSILNILSARVAAIEPECPAQVMVRLDCAGSPLLARITRKSADRLGLEKGKHVYAQVKSVALLD